VIRSLVHRVSDHFDEGFGSTHRWHGRRVFAVDGTKINVQRGDELAGAFGVPSGAHCGQVLVSTLFVAITRCLMAAAAVEHDVPYEDVPPRSGVLGLAAKRTTPGSYSHAIPPKSPPCSTSCGNASSGSSTASVQAAASAGGPSNLRASGGREVVVDVNGIAVRGGEL
jgi:hypothetical protein